MKNQNNSISNFLRPNNPKFYQFYEHNFALLTFVQRKYPIAMSILFFLIEKMDYRNSIVISQTALAELLDISRSTVYRNVKVLKEKEIIETYKTGSSTVYGINSDIVWRKSHDKKETAEFYSKVIITQNEQDQYDHKIKVKRKQHVEYELFKDQLGQPTRPYSNSKRKAKRKKLPETEASSAGDDNSPGIGSVR